MVIQIHPDCGNTDLAVYPKLAALADCNGVLRYHVLVYQVQRKAQQGLLYEAAEQLGELNGYIEELITGQKVVKVFHHEEESFTEFCKKNEELRKAGTGAQGYAATMVPVVVSISYVNYAIVAVLGGLLALHGKADIGSLASYLVFVRQAALPINQFTQQSNFLLSALARCGACLRRDEPGAGNR